MVEAKDATRARWLVTRVESDAEGRQAIGCDERAPAHVPHGALFGADWFRLVEHAGEPLGGSPLPYY